jgi:hypothetical protein
MEPFNKIYFNQTKTLILYGTSPQRLEGKMEKYTYFSDYLKPDKFSFKMLLLRVYSHTSLQMSRGKKKIVFVSVQFYY